MKIRIFPHFIAYRISRDLLLDEKILNEKLQDLAFTPLPSQSMAITGWAPLHEDSYCLKVNDFFLIRAKKEERIIPPKVIKKELAARVSKLEQQQARKLKRSEKDALKDEVMQSLMPRAFTKEKVVHAIINLQKRLILVESSNATQAENILALLRKSLGSLPVIPVMPQTPLELVMTGWLKHRFPANMAAGEKLTLKAVLDDGGVINCQKQDAASDEIMGHIDAGKVVTCMELVLNDCNTGVSSVVINDQMAFKRVEFDDIEHDYDDSEDADPVSHLSAEVLIVGSSLVHTLNLVLEAAGGEAKA